MGAMAGLVGLGILLVATGTSAETLGTVGGLTPAQVADLREARGVGLARVADVNGYPGPRHVLDMAAAGQLPLSPEQEGHIRTLHAEMAAEAKRLGALVLAAEGDLEAAFRRASIDEAGLAARLTRIAALGAALRQVHLRAHLLTRAVLTDSQVARYGELRGSAAPASTGHRHTP